MTFLQFIGYFLLFSVIAAITFIASLIYAGKKAAEKASAVLAAKAKEMAAKQKADQAAEVRVELEKQLAEANKEADATEAEATTASTETKAIEGFSNIPSPNDNDFDITKNNFEIYSN